MFKEEDSKEGHEDHHAVGENAGSGLSIIDGCKCGSVSNIDTHLVSLSLLLVSFILSGLLGHRGLTNTITLELIVFLVDILELLLLILHHHTDLEHTFFKVLDWDLLHGFTIEELKLKDLLGLSWLEFIVIFINRLVTLSSSGSILSGKLFFGFLDLGTVGIVLRFSGSWEILDVFRTMLVEHDDWFGDVLKWTTFLEHPLVDDDSHVVFLLLEFLPIVALGSVTCSIFSSGSSGIGNGWVSEKSSFVLSWLSWFSRITCWFDSIFWGLSGACTFTNLHLPFTISIG